MRAACAAVLAVAAGCAPSTSVTFDIRTDLPCSEVGEVGISAGPRGSTEDTLTTVTSACAADGTRAAVGTYVVVPRDGAVEVSVRIALAENGRRVEEDCTAARGYAGCIVARRVVSFIPRRGLVVPVDLFLACRDVACTAETTCNRLGRCQSSQVDPRRCANDECTLVEPSVDAGVRPAPSGRRSTWSATPDVLPADGLTTTELRLTLLDASGAPVAGQSVAFSATGSANLWQTAGSTTDDGGVFVVRLASRVAERKTVIADVGELALQTSVLFTAGLPGADGGLPGADGGLPDADGGLPDADGGLPDGGTAPGDGDGGWRFDAYVKPTNPLAQGRFGGAEDDVTTLRLGGAVALSASGAVLVVGASGDSSAAFVPSQGAVPATLDRFDTSAPEAGGVHVYIRGDGGWAFDAYLKATNTEAGDGFGTAVAISGDGTVIAVGAPEEDSSGTLINGNQADNSVSGAGAVYLYRRDGGWQHEAYVKAPLPSFDDRFGSSLALSSDGTALAVGAPNEQGSARGIGGPVTQDLMRAGAAYLYRRDSGTWSHEAYVKASNTAAEHSFGARVQLSGAGDVLAVAAPGEDSAFTGILAGEAPDAGPAGGAMASGAVYVFRRTGGTWRQEALLKGTNTGPDDALGRGLALSEDGTTVVAGAPREDGNGVGVDPPSDELAPGSGAVYVFRHAGAWAQTAYVKASNPGADDGFGAVVAVSRDGSALAVGAPYESSAFAGIGGTVADQASNGALYSGAVYSFVRSGAAWAQDQYIKSPLNGSYAVPQAVFGGGLALAAQNRAMAVATLNDTHTAAGVNGSIDGGRLDGAGGVLLYSRP